ncbi:MAG TPA: DNA modification methylase [Planctomycetota bacterium]|nr:DNA modification methylase [Planctomycetota bacterium]
MKIEMRQLSQIKPYEKNPRVNDQAVDAVARSIQEYGFRQPIVVDEAGVIIVGHTRWKAAQKLGLAEVPVHVAVDLPPEKVKAYRLADNKLAELAEWDLDLLPIELSELRGMDVDLGMLGFAPEELEKLLGAGIHGTEGLTDPDAIPDPPDEAVTRPGDLWVLGDHRLLCGDSSKAEDVDRLLAGAVIDLVNMDPPYNVKVEPRSNNAIAAGLSSFVAYGNTDPGRDVHRNPGSANPTHAKLRAKDRPLENDFVSDEDFQRMLLAWFGNAARVLKPGGSYYIWGGYANIGNYPAPLAKCELYFSQCVVWNKLHPVLTRKDFMGAHEICFYGWREGAGHKFYGPNNVPDIWAVKKVNPQSMIHLTEKPVELAERAMQYSSLPGQNVLDLFGGSGSTLIAAEKTGRKAFLVEIDELYCDVIVKRWEEFTGKKAERIAVTETTPTVAAGVGVGEVG